jgi:putative membrane protein
MTRADIGDHLALLNACLNATSAILLVAGRFAIAQKRTRVHRGLMLGALATSTTFLLSYLTRVALTGTHADPHHGVVHVVYLTVLITHMILAIAVVPMVLTALYFAWKAKFV